MKKVFVIIAGIAIILLGSNAFAQGTPQNDNLAGQSKNYIPTGMPIITIAPDAVSAALGDAGVASEPDAYSAHWNNAKFAFADPNFGISTTYTPWLRKVGVSDMNLLYLGAYKKLNKRSTLAASLLFFSLGEIQSTDIEGNDQELLNPNEFTIDVTYSMKIAKRLALGATVRYLRSDLTNGMEINDGSGYTTTSAANAIAADVGLYYENTVDAKQEFAIGAFFSNLGSKFRYSEDDTQTEFLPANLRIGGRYSYNIDDYNKFNVLLDFNKLLVPTPPTEGENGHKYYENMVDYHQTGVMQGVWQSFFDAPGGFREEMQEIQFSLGAEYWYNNLLAARAGYFFEHANKGGRQYATVGVGVKYSFFQLDFAYLIPTTKFSTNPLSNTMRISLTVNIGNNKNKNRK